MWSRASPCGPPAVGPVSALTRAPGRRPPEDPESACRQRFGSATVVVVVTCGAVVVPVTGGAVVVAVVVPPTAVVVAVVVVRGAVVAPVVTVVGRGVAGHGRRGRGGDRGAAHHDDDCHAERSGKAGNTHRNLLSEQAPIAPARVEHANLPAGWRPRRRAAPVMALVMV